MLFTNGESVTILRSGGRNKYGDTSYTESHQIHNVGIDYRDSDRVDSSDSRSQVENRDTVVTEIVLYCPTGSDILVTDKVELPDGSMCRVAKRPLPSRSPFTGWGPGVVVHLQLIEG